ncbi:tRNA methyltransferase RSM22 [Aspergillus melleus]|uniref:tRNA methyltransferase RSM22 n=1 Tax=Aspergillus melleus TaxID=138277 RepID=UPI001E8E2F40|nr:37S ribosomal protein S22 [Aspergillus melleus]KAH8423332.1 37S ribosomal protein S22 [Aspergillus melleus]
MLSRTSAARASRPCSHRLLRPIANRPPQTGLQQLRGAASFLPTRQRSSAITPKSLSPNSAVRVSLPVLNHGVRTLGARHASTTPPAEAESNTERKDAIYALIDEINENEMKLAVLMDDLNLLDDYFEALNFDGPELDDVFSQTIGHRDAQTLEARVRSARQEFGDTLPEDHLNATEIELYTQLYGEPIFVQEHTEELEVQDEEDLNTLYREDGEGGWQEVDVEEAVSEEEEEEVTVAYDMETGPQEDETAAMQRTREIAEQLGGDIMLEQFGDDTIHDDAPRLHPRTVEGKFATDPSTIYLPKDTVTGPISAILSDFSNKHISEAARRTFGGSRLPHSTYTPIPRAQTPQTPIPLSASQRHMTEMEANAYIAALYPGLYASALSVLTEVRKRLGPEWIRGLMSQEEGPHVLDASAGGAGVLAWRDVLRAEWELMVPDQPEGSPYPVGRSTVVAGSESLQLRASAMLENTSFLPRLPDYVHVREKPTLDDSRAPPRRKQYDVIIAPHSLLGIEEEYMRKEHVENLWNLLNPNGGVLILLEKGHQRGFEAVAGAREMLLKRHIASPGSTQYENLTESPSEDTHVQKEAGMIVAPCTNHGKCPMYHMDGHSKGRRDYCHFEQRYIRPQFLQRIVGAKDRNHEDVRFSYVAVQRGADLRETQGIVQGPEATEAAFAGYEHVDDAPADEAQVDEAPPASQDGASSSGQNFHTLSLPRIVYPPIKRRGHIIFDSCTPAGNIERWTVPRSFSRRAYKDARKARWGDLWALGAKTRIHRNLRLGDKHGEGKKERLQRRAAAKEELSDAEKDELEHQREMSSSSWPELAIPPRKKGQTIPSWKKAADKKKLRQATKQYTASKFSGEE